MQITPGSRLGPYEILAPLGAGGMGEVYRARDTRLGREVAVKVLPQHLSTNPEVRARFEREAKTVSALNHPNICTLFDVGHESDVAYLVMELIDGETLAARLQRGPLPIPDVTRIGVEIADALDRAHRAGVVHRDLKPGNIMLTKSGAKLMDFGLARSTEITGDGTSGMSASVLDHSPTVAQPLTAEGTLVGTFQYMAPEQLEGGEVSERSDLWALGCVLYEMTTGRRPFVGKSQASLITSIMGSEPEAISHAAPLAPPGLDRLVQACLAKDPADRIQSAHDVKLQLAWIRDAGSQAGVPRPVAKRRRQREAIAWSVAVVALVLAAAAIAYALRPKPAAVCAMASIEPPPGVLFSSSVDLPLPLAISPDGTLVAFCARHGDGPDQLWIRSLGAEDAHPIGGTENAQGPFFSPDGRSVAFFADRRLKRVDVAGGPVIDLAESLDPRGGTWGRDDVILFPRNGFGPVWQVSASGGTVAAATGLDTTIAEATHRYPYFLPDGRDFLYLARRAGSGAGEKPTIYASTLRSTERTPVLELASNVQYASGYVLYVQGLVLMAQPFNLKKLAVTGAAVPLIDDIRMDERFSRAVFSTSTNGVLVCMTGSAQAQTQLRWLDRSGRSLGDVGEPADYTYGGTPELSPDGGSAVLAIANRDRGTSDVWIIDLQSGRRRKLTVDTLDHPDAMWALDGKSVFVTSSDSGAVDRIAIDGTRSQRLVATQASDYHWPLSQHGHVLLYSAFDGERNHLRELDLSQGGMSTPFVATAGAAFHAQFSPDGRFVTYTSDQTGRTEVFVSAYPQPGGTWQVSQDGGSEPRWSREGKELIFVDRENYLVAVDVDASHAFVTGEARRLFQFHGAGSFWRYDVSFDGERFLVTTPLEENLKAPLTLITNWPAKVENR